MPRCSPERARICDAPLSRNVDMMSLSRPVRSPVTSAEMSAFVLLSAKGRAAMPCLIFAPRAVIRSGMTVMSGDEETEVILWVNPVRNPHPAAARIIMARTETLSHFRRLGCSRHKSGSDIVRTDSAAGK